MESTVTFDQVLNTATVDGRTYPLARSYWTLTLESLDMLIDWNTVQLAAALNLHECCSDILNIHIARQLDIDPFSARLLALSDIEDSHM